MGVAGDSRQFRCRGMECSKVFSRRKVVLISRVDHRIVVHLMQEQVTTIAGFNNGIGGGGVARDDNATVGSVEAVSERLIPRAVPDEKRCYLHVRISVNHARLYFMHLDPRWSRFFL